LAADAEELETKTDALRVLRELLAFLGPEKAGAVLPVLKAHFSG